MRPLPLLLAGLLAACAAPRQQRQLEPAPLRLTVVATNDFHGWLEPHALRIEGGGTVPVGGIDVFAAYLARLRAEGPVVLVDAGDMWQGTLASNLSEGAAVVEAYGALGYDAAALGNHEFDFGPVGEKMVARTPGENPLGALEARAAQARFPFLGANVFEKETGAPPPWLQQSVLIERGGIRVGLVGLATPDTPQVTISDNVRTLRFGDPFAAAVEQGEKLRAAGAEVLVLVAHIGGHCLEADACEGELIDLVRALPAGLYDVAVGGHTHRVVETVVGGVPVIESGALGRAFGTVELTLDPHTRRVIPGATRAAAGVEICALHFEGTERCDPAGGSGPLVPARFRGAPIQPDPEIAALVRPWLRRVEEVRARRLGAVLPATFRLDYDGESDVGNLVADAMLAITPEASLAITNSGGLRAELPGGELTFGHVFETLPFDNRLSLLRIKGSTLRHLVRNGFAGVHGGLQVSANVRVVVDRAACASADLDGDGAITPLDRDRLVSLEVDGRPVEDDADYVVVTNDFLAGGGGGWDRVLNRLSPGSIRHLEDRPAQRDAFAGWLEGRGALAVPPRGRIELRGTPPACPPGR